MDKNIVLNKIDYTNLKQDATWEDIKKLCDDAIKYGCASVCIPPCYVREAYEYVKGRLPICTVIGFPNGYMSAKSKFEEAKNALLDKASEIDMVINIGKLKAGDDQYVLDEIRRIKYICERYESASQMKRTLKVIIETCLLSEEEKIRICKIVSEAGADFIKTSTGFSKHGATFEDVALMRKHCSPEIKIKAAGGIRSYEDAVKYIELGADRLGMSNISDIVSRN